MNSRRVNKNVIPLERQIHKTIVRYLRMALPTGSMINHSPNGGMRESFRKYSHAFGVLAGWPDLVVIIPASKWISKEVPWGPVYLEIKRAKKGVVSEQQMDVHHGLVNAGCHVAVVRTVDEVIFVLKNLCELKAK